MQSLMGELDSNPEMQREFERMMAELVQAGQAPSDAEAAEHIGKATEAVQQTPPAPASAPKTEESADSSSKKPSPSSNAQQESFQDTIRKTMERMQASGASADAAAASGAPASSEEDMIAQMMKELQAGGEGGGEEDFNKMLMSMMSQLTNKEILYEPMKELHDKFPAWMEKNAPQEGKQEGVSKEDMERYREQQGLVEEIVGRFERKGYSDENEDDREYIVERMQKVRRERNIPTLLVRRLNADSIFTDASRRLATTRSCGRHERRARSPGRTRRRLSHAVMGAEIAVDMCLTNAR